MANLLGRYELRKAIGRGAAGTVWDGWDTILARQVAIKVVRTQDKEEADLRELLDRFRQEAQLGSRFSHPGVVQVYDYNEIAGDAFIVMEFVDGETLKTALDRKEPLPLPRVAEIMCGVLLALEPCHRQNIVHRDIKPSNIMLPAAGGVKLADFGIARAENSELTIAGTILGTPLYMSPEQFTARDPVDFRSDIWSAGAVFYELLTGTRPFRGNSMAAIGQSVVNDDAEPPSRRVPGLPPALDRVVDRALRKSPAERFGSAQEFWLAIQAAIPPPALPPPPRPIAGRGAVLAAAVGLAVAAAGGGLWLWYPAHREPEPRLSVEAQVLALPCSTVAVRTGGSDQDVQAFRGLIGSGAPRAALDAIVARLPAAEVAVRTFPNTDVSCRFAELVRTYAGGAHLSSNGDDAPLFAGDEMRVRLTMPDFAGVVRLDDLDANGMVSHMMEANMGAPPRHPAGTTVGLGPGGDDLIGHASEPFGTDLLVAVVSSEPLLSSRRPATEDGGTFREELTAAMAALRRRGGRVAADAIVVTTARR